MNEAPTASEVKQARLKAKLSTKEAGRLIYVSNMTWLKWEFPDSHPKQTLMHPALAELFALKTGLLKIEDVAPTLTKIQNLKDKT